MDWRLLCKVTLDKDELTKFKEAIHNSYFFEMFVEDLPMWGYIGDIENEDIVIGEVEGSKTYLFPHLHFRLGYNKDQIVSAKVTTEVSTRGLSVVSSLLSFLAHACDLFVADGTSGGYNECGNADDSQILVFGGVGGGRALVEGSFEPLCRFAFRSFIV